MDRTMPACVNTAVAVMSEQAVMPNGLVHLLYGAMAEMHKTHERHGHHSEYPAYKQYFEDHLIRIHQLCRIRCAKELPIHASVARPPCKLDSWHSRVSQSIRAKWGENLAFET